jgi:hypothetical protein
MGKRLKLYLEEWDPVPGREFRLALAKALHESETCDVFPGPNALGPWQKQEIQIAIDKRARDKANHVIPVLVPALNGPGPPADVLERSPARGRPKCAAICTTCAAHWPATSAPGSDCKND